MSGFFSIIQMLILLLFTKPALVLVVSCIVTDSSKALVELSLYVQ